MSVTAPAPRSGAPLPKDSGDDFDTDPEAPAKRSKRRGRVNRELGRLSWAVLIVLYGLAAVRVVGLDSIRLGNVVATFLPWILLPSYLFVVAGVGLRRIGLFLAALGLVLIHLVWIRPELPSPSPVSAAAADAPKLRVLNSNVLFTNPQVNDLYDEMAAADADVITFHEVQARFHNELAAHPLATEMPHWHSNVHGTVILSRYPFVDTTHVMLDNELAPVVTIEVEGRRVRIASVHPATPLTDFDGWREALVDLKNFAAADNEQLVILGDFNATMQHRPFRNLLDGANLRDAHNERGDGWGGTWPMGAGSQRFSPPLRIDHILVGPGIEVTEFENRANPGSDHRALVADLAITG